LKKLVFALVSMFTLTCTAFAQGNSTISRAGDLQLGGGYTSANSDYVSSRINGFALYGDFDFFHNLGVEVDFHQVSDSPSKVYERTYEVGVRYVRHYGRLGPYAKIMVGRGVFNYPQNEANLAYNMYAIGGGLDYAVLPKVNVRADYEYQSWSSFKPNGLTPQMLTIGVAYHFSSGNLSAR
jgi:opacity protein-like surface antigen